MTEPTINLDELIGKRVGHPGPASPEEAHARLLRTARPITGGMTQYPRGVFRFKTHEEANEWTRKHIRKAAKRR
jgi:hypothetical protein